MVIELATDPRGYFAERIKYPRIRRQAMIVLLAGLVANIWRPFLMVGLGAPGDYIADVLIILTFAGILEFVLVWLALTAVLYVVTGLVGGDTEYGRLLRLTGYGFIPLIASGAIWSIGHYLTYTDVGAPAPPAMARFYSRYQSYSEFMAQGAGDLVLMGSIAIGSMFVLASGYLWYQAIGAATELEREKAIIPAAVAMGCCFVWIFLTVV